MGCCFSRGKRAWAADPAPLLAHDTAGSAAAATDAGLKLQQAVAKGKAKRSFPTLSEEAIGLVPTEAADTTEATMVSPATKREEAVAATLQQGISAAAEVLQEASEPVTAPDAQPEAPLMDVEAPEPTRSVPAPVPVAPVAEPEQPGTAAMPAPVAAPAKEEQQPAKRQGQKRGGKKRGGKGGRK